MWFHAILTELGLIQVLCMNFHLLDSICVWWFMFNCCLILHLHGKCFRMMYLILSFGIFSGKLYEHVLPFICCERKKMKFIFQATVLIFWKHFSWFACVSLGLGMYWSTFRLACISIGSHCIDLATSAFDCHAVLVERCVLAPEARQLLNPYRIRFPAVNIISNALPFFTFPPIF